MLTRILNRLGYEQWWAVMQRCGDGDYTTALFSTNGFAEDFIRDVTERELDYGTLLYLSSHRVWLRVKP